MKRAASPHTCAVPLLRSQSKAAVAATLETPDGVPAISVGAETLEHFALVHICRRFRLEDVSYSSDTASP